MRRQTLTVTTGAVRRDEIPLLHDMLGSEEVYLIGAGAASIRVLPELTEVNYTRRPDEPVIFTLEFVAADEEEHSMADIDTGMEFHSRVFSRQFTKEFN